MGVCGSDGGGSGSRVLLGGGVCLRVSFGYFN